MKFLCLGYYDAARMDVLPRSEIDAIMADCRPHLDTLYATGQVLVDIGIDVEARSLRRADGPPRVTPGRVIASEAVIGAVFVIEARDYDEALAVAAKHPSAQLAAGDRFGWAIEVRPIHTYRTPVAA